MLIHSKVFASYVNGPGKRYVLWTQGCKKACKNCFNPLTWSSTGEEVSVDSIVKEICNSDCEGFTLTGGDPLEQPEETLKLVKDIYNLNLPKGIIIFTGFTLDEINEIGGSTKEILKYIDLLIDGRFIDELRTENGLKGSSNQNLIFLTNKLKNERLNIDQEIEIGMNENLYITGFPFINKKILKKFGIYVK
jgi:anaerobic ribonucleoside-triphosphate reductase activating protein